MLLKCTIGGNWPSASNVEILFDRITTNQEIGEMVLCFLKYKECIVLMHYKKKEWTVLKCTIRLQSPQAKKRTQTIFPKQGTTVQSSAISHVVVH